MPVQSPHIHVDHALKVSLYSLNCKLIKKYQPRHVIDVVEVAFLDDLVVLSTVSNISIGVCVSPF